MTIRFASLFSLCVIGCVSPAVAQMSLGPVTEPSQSSAPSIEMSLGSSLETSASEAGQMGLSAAEGAADAASASEELTTPPGEDEVMSGEPGDGTDMASEEEPSGPPLASKDAFATFYKVCADLGGGDAAAYDRANSDGWTPDDTETSGPYRTVYSATKPIAGYGHVQVWSSIESYASQRLGYCRVDFSDADNRLDFHDLNGMNGLTGTVDDEGENGLYGAWESPDKKLMIIADRTGGDASIEFNLLLPPAAPAQ